MDLRQVRTVLPGKIFGHIGFKVVVMRRHHPSGEDLLPAGIGIIAQVPESAVEIADHGRRQRQADLADIRPNVRREKDSFVDRRRHRRSIGGCGFQTIAFSDVDGVNDAVAIQGVATASRQFYAARHPWFSTAATPCHAYKAQSPGFGSPAGAFARQRFQSRPSADMPTVSCRFSGVRFMILKPASKLSPSVTWLGITGRISVRSVDFKTALSQPHAVPGRHRHGQHPPAGQIVRRFKLDGRPGPGYPQQWKDSSSDKLEHRTAD